MSTLQTLNNNESGLIARGKINSNFTALNTDKLQSTDLKTVNGNSLVGSGDIVISGGGSVATDTIWDAKGDLAVGTGANNASRLAVGSNGQILVADSTQATGVKWATASGTGDMLASTYDPAGIAQQVVGTTATQTISGKTLTAPKFVDNGFIADSNGNEMVSFNQNASAVNYLEIENGSTTNPPHLRAMGDDPNIGLHLVGRGTGLVSVCDATDETKRIRFQPNNSTGVTTTLASSDTASHTITLPNATDTLVGKATTDTLTNKTLTSPVINTPTGIVKGDVGLGNVDNTSDATKNSATATLTNKRKQPRIVSATSYTTDTGTSLDVSTTDIFVITAQAGALLFNAPSGTPVQGEKLIIRIKDNGTSRSLTYNAIYRAIGVTLPTATTISKTTYMGFVYNSTDTKWDCIAVGTEA